MNYISDLLDFSHPSVGYEDSKGKDVCGCCGTHFVVSVGEAEEIKEIASDMYEALELIRSKALLWQLTEEERERVIKALSKAEGKETK